MSIDTEQFFEIQYPFKLVAFNKLGKFICQRPFVQNPYYIGKVGNFTSKMLPDRGEQIPTLFAIYYFKS